MFQYLVQLYINIIRSTKLYFIDSSISDMEKETFTIMLLTSPIISLVEGSNILNFAYSKFGVKNRNDGVSSRAGMFALYFPPLLTFLVSAHRVVVGISWWHTVISMLIIVHFTKRCMETLYIHRYSGSMSYITVIFISFFYSAFSFTIGYYLANRINGRGEVLEIINLREFEVGLFLFMVGMCGNY